MFSHVVFPARVTWNHVVEIELLPRQNPRAILTRVLVAVEDVAPRQFQFLARQLVEKREQNHARQSDRARRRVHRLDRRHRRVARRKIDPVHHRKHPKIVAVMVHHVRVPAREQGERPPGADHIHGLPQAIQNQHRLVESNVHTGQSQYSCHSTAVKRPRYTCVPPDPEAVRTSSPPFKTCRTPASRDRSMPTEDGLDIIPLPKLSSSRR